MDLSTNLLSIQSHYDWSLRALKPILKTAGKLLRDTPNPEKSLKFEESIFIQAVKINTLSKLTDSDRVLFLNILKDFFTVLKDGGHENLTASSSIFEPKNVQAVCQKLNYHYTENLRMKLIELNEQLEQRMGVVIIGPTCSGKSVLWTILAHLLSASHQVINAKAMPRRKLLGNVNENTREWTDGVLTAASRLAVEQHESSKKRAFIICDSDIDPEWIEALNSVLDDNKLLTLPSGERIQFPQFGINFIFETHDLTPASPATVSRMGIIFMSENDVKIESLVKSFNFDKEIEFKLEEIVVLLTDVFSQAHAFETDKSQLSRSAIAVTQDILTNLSKVKSSQEMAFITAQSLFSSFKNEFRNKAVAHFINITSRYGLTVPDSSRPNDCYLYNKMLHAIGTGNSVNKTNGLVMTYSLAVWFF